MVSGAWDFAGLLFATSGILLFVVPLLFNEFFQRLKDQLPLEEETEPSFTWLRQEAWLVWATYYVLLPLLALALLWWRRGRTVIYNVDTEMFNHVLRETLAKLGLTSVRRGNRLILAPRPIGDEKNDGIIAGEAPAQRVMETRLSGSAEIAVEVFPAMRNITLRWLRAEGNLRTAIEDQLDRAIEGIRTFDNPAAGWLTALGGALFGLVFLTGMIWVFSVYFRIR
jgi:hypothetical protein